MKEQPVEKNSEAQALVVADHFAPPAVSERALVVGKERSAERAAYARAWDSLSARQKVYLRALQQTGFNRARALKVLNEAIRLDPFIIDTRRMYATRVSSSTASRWAKDSESYKFVLAALKAEAAVQVTSRDDLLLRAHRAAEYAEEEQPILYQGEHTGFTERKPDVMLRANEQLMKATKVLGDDSRGPVGGSGPTLLIQVIQKDGGTVDVTPRGVTIDLPAPDGP